MKAGHESFDGALHATLWGCGGAVRQGRIPSGRRTAATVSVKADVGLLPLGSVVILKVLN
jgi:hypothetical protein